MDTVSFRRFLKKLGKKEHVIDGLIRQVERFEQYLSQEQGKELTGTAPEDIRNYVAALEAGKPGEAREELRGIALYFKSSGNAYLAFISLRAA